jgi:alpha-L-fucosidase
MSSSRCHRAARLFFATAIAALAAFAGAAEPWRNPLTKLGRLGSPLVEVTPFVFKDRLYCLENNQKFWDIGGKPGDRYREDEVRVRDVATNEIVSIALKNCGFGTALVDKGRVYVFAGDYGKDKPWRQITEITMTSSADLIHWTDPVVVLRVNQHDNHFWNTAVARGPDGYVLLVETSDKRFPTFTFRYLRSKDLIHWEPIPDAFYGKDKYVGGPALYYEGAWYYTLYLESLGEGKYETRITRSKDLVHWQDAPADRPFLTFDSSHQNIPLLDPAVRESNASDAELAYFRGNTIVYFTGSDQTTAGDLQRATFNGTPRQLFERFFEGVSNVPLPANPDAPILPPRRG